MSVVVRTEGFNPLHSVITDLIRRSWPVHGKTKAAEARAGGEQHGWLDGAATVLAAYGTQNRIEVLRAVGYTEQFATAVESWNVHGWLRKVRERWQAGEWTGASDEEFLREIEEEFDGLVRNTEIRDLIFRVRKQSILSGILDPTPEDAEWLQEEGSSFKSLSLPYEQALSKLTKPVDEDILYPDEAKA